MADQQMTDHILIIVIAVLATCLAITLICILVYILYRRRCIRDVELGTSPAYDPEQMDHLQYLSSISESVKAYKDFSLRPHTTPRWHSENYADRQDDDVTFDHTERNTDSPTRSYGVPKDDGVWIYNGNLQQPAFDLVSPIDCSSGRHDHDLIELLQPNMKESVTTTVDTKLLVFISREIDHMGGHLVLDKMGISLFIPPCAIPPGRKEIIQLVLNWDLSDFPEMSDKQTIIGPVVHCGPHGLALKKPAVLSFRHCASDVKDVVVMTSETHLSLDKDWKSVDLNKIGHDVYHLLPNECQMYLSHFSLYTCLAEGTYTKKWIQLVAFGRKIKIGKHYQLRVFLLNNTPCALQFATQDQAKHNFKQLGCPVEFLYDARGSDMILRLENLNEGWSYGIDERQERVPFPNIWQGKCPSVLFVFKHENQSVTDISINISAFQKDMEHEKRSIKMVCSMLRKQSPNSTHTNCNHTNVQVVVNKAASEYSDSPAGIGGDSGLSASETVSCASVTTDERRHSNVEVTGCCGIPSEYERQTSSESDSSSEITAEGSPAIDQHPFARERTFTSGSNAQQNTIIKIVTKPPKPTLHRTQAPPTDMPHLSSEFIVPHKLRMTLVTLLDPINVLGNDWRILASNLDMDALITFLKTKNSPTEILLDEVEQREKGCEWLAKILFDASRLDAANEIMKYVRSESGVQA